MKSATVLFGDDMPEAFRLRSEADFKGWKGKTIDDDTPVEHRPPDCMFVVGTSVSVYPTALLPDMIDGNAPRVLVNRERAGNFNFASRRDFFLQGDCDRIILQLVKEIGWLGDLEKYREGMCEASQRAYDEIKASPPVS